MEIQNVISKEDRVRELMKMKKKLLTKLKRNQKEQIKARIQKRKINEELRGLLGKKNLFTGMDNATAQAAVRKTIESVRPGDIYPAGLEKEFDRLERPKKSSESYKVVDLGRIPEAPIATKPTEDETVVGSDAEANVEESETEGVLDLSDL